MDRILVFVLLLGFWITSYILLPRCLFRHLF